jgi:hypothetical protein
MSYKLLNETDDHFELEHEKDGPFVIAKKALDDQMIGKIHKMFGGGRVGYADGGVVAAPSLYSESETDFSIQTPEGDIQTLPKNFDDVETMNLYNRASAQKAKEVQEFEQKQAQLPPPPARLPVTGAPPPRIEPTTQPMIEPTPVDPTAPLANVAPAQQKPLQPAYMDYMQQILGQKPQQISPELPPDMAKAYQEMKGASLIDAQAKAEAFKENELAYKKAAENLADEEWGFQTKMQSLEDERNRLFNDTQNFKIDPTRIWTNMSTGNKVLAGISILLGGLGQGLTGRQTNPAMDVINNAIDRDIDAQKSELGKKTNLLSVNMQKYGQLRDALSATKMQIMTVLQSQVNQSASKLGTKQAQAAAQMFNADIDLKMAALKQQLASSLMMQEKMNKPGGITANDINKLDEKTRELIVPMPPTSGALASNYTFARTPEGRKKIEEAVVSYNQVMPFLQKVQNFMKEGTTLPLTEKNSMAEMYAAELFLIKKEIGKLGTISGSDIELVEPLIPQPGKLFDAGEKRKMDLLIQRADDMLNSVYSAYAGYNRSSLQNIQRPVFGGP